jgi:hypothetical protein
MRYVPCSVMGMRHFIHVLPALLLICSTSLNAADKVAPKRAPLTLSLSTNVAPAPAQVTARVRLEPDARSRSLTIEWWSVDGAGGSHLVNLDGEYAATRQDFAIKRIEAGEYIVRAVLVRDDGSLIKKESNLVVVGEGSTFSANSRGSDLMVEPSARGRR